MYCAFFRLREQPFNVTADPKFLYLNARYREALASLHYGITQRKGFVTLIGEAGTGKTTLLRSCSTTFPKARAPCSSSTQRQLRRDPEFILAEFGKAPLPGTTKLALLQALNT